MFENPADAWAARAKQYRISDTRECRNAFYRGALYGAIAAGEAVIKSDPEILARFNQALQRFARDQC